MAENISQERRAEYSINPVILKRWSPRAMSGEMIDDAELMALFEAARWAPSSFNGQPWRFIYAKKNTEHWDRLFHLMGEFNQSWVKNAAVLVVVISKKTFDHNGQFSRTHEFDAGAAWENLALEATTRELVTHGMAGFDYDKAREVLEIPEEFDIEAMIAIGKEGKKEDLPEALQEAEIPSGRKLLKELVMEGKFRS